MNGPDGKPVEFAGDHMVLEEREDGSATIRFDDNGTGRRCGSCQLCCKLVPVASMGKAAGERCKHSRAGKGCAIYARRPDDCRTWSCRWLCDPSTAGLPRPDKAHYVIDLEYDYLTSPDPSLAGQKQTVLQVWVDPAFPHAHRDPALRSYLFDLAERWKVPAIIRYNSRDAFLLLAPPLSGDGQWHEMRDNLQLGARTPLERAALRNWDVHAALNHEHPTESR